MAYGREQLVKASECIAVEGDRVAELMVAALERKPNERQAAQVANGRPTSQWQVEQVKVGFSVQLARSADMMVFSGSVESSAQITLTFARL